MNISDEIKRLHELHQAGALTDAEFEQAKNKLLNASASFNTGSGSSQRPAGEASNDINQLRRSRSDRWLGGVCGGLAKQTGMESWIWRLIFTLFSLTFGVALGIYLLMWIFVPDE